MLPIAATVVTLEFCLNERGDGMVLAFQLLGVLPGFTVRLKKARGISPFVLTSVIVTARSLAWAIGLRC
jgi:hypothetical protein